MTWIDTPWPQNPAKLKANGYDIMRYLCSPWNTGPGTSMPNKRLERPELDGYIAAGVDVAVNFEDAADDYLGGYPRGNEKGKRAGDWMRNTLAFTPGASCCSSLDTDIGATWGGVAQEYQRGFADGLTATGPYLPGIYGSAVALNGALASGTAHMFWLTAASSWSHGIQPKVVHLRQNGLWPFGNDADLNVTVIEPIGSYLHPMGEMEDMTPEQSQQLTDLWNWFKGARIPPGQTNLGSTIAATLPAAQATFNKVNAVSTQVAGLPTSAQVATMLAKIPGEITLTPEQLAALTAALGELAAPNYSGHATISISPDPVTPA